MLVYHNYQKRMSLGGQAKEQLTTANLCVVDLCSFSVCACVLYFMGVSLLGLPFFSSSVTILVIHMYIPHNHVLTTLIDVFVYYPN